MTSSLKALATSLGIKRATAKFINDSQAHGVESEGNNMPGFSPGKIFGSTKARDSLAAHATPYSNIPPSESLPETDFFKFATPDASFLEDDALAADDTVGGPSPAKSSIRLGAEKLRKMNQVRMNESTWVCTMELTRMRRVRLPARSWEHTGKQDRTLTSTCQLLAQ